MSKRFIKQTTAAVLLTTSVLSFSPAALGATNSAVDQAVNKTKAELNKATTHYVYPSLEEKLVSSSALYPVLNSTKKNYQAARKAVVTSKLSTSAKEAKLKEIDGLYSEKVSGGLVPYIDAYNYATEYLVPIMKELEAAQARNDFAAVDTAYHKLSYQLKGRTAILYRFSGKAARDLLLERYKKPADAKRDEMMVPVTIHMSLVKINDLLDAGKKAEAKKEFGEVEALLDRLPTAASNSFIKALLDEVAKVKVAVGEATATPQQKLDEKVGTLVKALNASQFDNITAATGASNSLIIVVKKDVGVVDFLGKGFYESFIKELGLTKVNGLDPTSKEAATFIASKFPVGTDSLEDLKGQTITLPITVNNGADLTVDFTILFQ
ncbi:hypothetical protein [Psychrobacillus lasiicapitis]|uniref:SbsC C-terminal domain-containing protein n=1 Tax=Psychrobacillus lasiicapitis TaxID=1636719 RepID=A0A544T331_9BACI|nr:hypothetical protein [Psychrobacillus lasiicapitis]TQR11862.1 hypothetical protein FG382_14720 [Psychrobacillus lasiicapitis]GGA20041.1 hypothetical protein GCM10011384_06750 [Psychrobacillus lasiicapitis]